MSVIFCKTEPLRLLEAFLCNFNLIEQQHRYLSRSAHYGNTQPR